MSLKIHVYHVYDNQNIKDGFSLTIVASVDHVSECDILKNIIENHCQSYCMGVTIESLGHIKIKKLYSLNMKAVYLGKVVLTTTLIK